MLGLFGLIHGGMIDILGKGMIKAMLADIDENMTRKMRNSMPAEYRDQVDDDYVNRFACAVYYASIAFPYELLQEGFGVINVGWNLMRDIPEKVSPAAMVELFKDGFSDLSPTMAAAVTEEVIIQTAKLLLNDWADNGQPDAETMKMDTHFYFNEVIGLYSSVDDEAVRREGAEHILAMTPEQLANYPADMFDVVREWHENQKDK